MKQDKQKTKVLKAVTDFGIQEVKTIGNKKEIAGEFWIVAEVPVKYMNAAEPLILRRVLHYKTGCNIPISDIKHNATAKDYLNKAESFLSRIPIEKIKEELSQHETINTLN